ncbi:MAG TPA: UDP-N-acetylmuramate dehydrogenase [Pirellulales bacterium]|nr:UDP-N-acetylmuramate dehydrogenase [Pirellulales bacterium]
MTKTASGLGKEFDHILRREEPLSQHTWFRLGGVAEYFAEPTSVDELAALVRRCREQNLPVRILGGGSNILVRDEGVPGVVCRLDAPAFSQISTKGDRATASGGAKLGHVISVTVRDGLAGLEPLVGIPGTIGGALHGNSGSRGGDIGQWTCRAAVMTRSGEIVERGRNEMVFAYRQSSLDELVILEAEFQLEPENPDELTKRMQKQWIVKKAAQPMTHQNSGCIFKNPRGLSAGMLIENAGLKNTRVGGAEVCDRHANFIVTTAEATGKDVLKLIDLVRSRVAERLGVELETEIEIW